MGQVADTCALALKTAWMDEVLQFFLRLFDASDWPPRWHCGVWSQFHGWLYIFGDLLIWSAYFTIPVVILKFISRKQDVYFVRLYFLFAAFILACGSTHFLDAAAFWVPMYRLNALLRLITGVLSWITVYYLIKFLPGAFSKKTSMQLEAEIHHRKLAEEKVMILNTELEQRVVDRTTELRKLNENLEDRIRLRTLQLEAMNIEMESFTYSVSHDLQSPLRGILGFTSLLEKRIGSGLDNESARLFGVVKKSTLKMQQLIEDLLLFSRMGMEGLVMTSIDFNVLTEEVIKELTPPESAITWVVGDMPMVTADLSSIRQVWVNLISNAIKYSSKNTGPRIELGCTKEKGDFIFFVKDNGVGFDSEYKSKLFKVFQRLHSVEEFEGTGIGLAIVHKIVSKHGGKVWSHAERDKGASFFFSLPSQSVL